MAQSADDNASMADCQATLDKAEPGDLAFDEVIQVEYSIKQRFPAIVN